MKEPWAACVREWKHLNWMSKHHNILFWAAQTYNTIMQTNRCYVLTRLSLYYMNMRQKTFLLIKYRSSVHSVYCQFKTWRQRVWRNAREPGNKQRRKTWVKFPVFLNVRQINWNLKNYVSIIVIIMSCILFFCVCVFVPHFMKEHVYVTAVAVWMKRDVKLICDNS
jgi:hypothetical protein